MAATSITTAQIRYTLNYTDSTKSKVSVTIQPSKALSTPVEFVMPRSIPGSYSILKYDLYIEDLQASGINGGTYFFIKNQNDAPRWSCKDSGILIRSISYEVNIDKMERQLFSAADASIIRKGFAGLLNYSVFGWIDGTELEPVLCSIKTFTQWPIFSTLVPASNIKDGDLQFNADNYYALADGQTFMGPSFQVKEFKALVPLFVVSYSEVTKEYLDDYGWQEAKSMEILKDYFGGFPFKHYSLILRSAIPAIAGKQSSMAMEHLASSTFFGDTSFVSTSPLTEEERLQTIPTYLHHMSHAFIPLHCYGDAYRPYVMEIPPIINNIWFNEGFMWYIVYDALKIERMIRLFQNNVYNTSPIIKKMSLQQLSQTASMQYGDDFRLGRAVYSRGALMAKEINDYVIKKTSGGKSIKDIYRYLYLWSIKNERPFTLEEFPGMLKAATGVDISAIYDKWQKPIEK